MSIVNEIYDAYQIAEKNGWLDKLLIALAQSNNLLILGSTGVGKTQLRESIKSVNTELIDPQHRTEFPVLDRLTINKNLFELVDLPGQELHASRRMQAVREALRKSRVGVINVVCYG
jgi:predicted GTPase